jgi:hypothetical protein
MAREGASVTEIAEEFGEPLEKVVGIVAEDLPVFRRIADRRGAQVALARVLAEARKEALVPFRHTPATDAVIRAGYRVNRPIRDMADELGVTRDVVCGRARRLGLVQPARRASAGPRHKARERLQAAIGQGG